MRILDDPSHCHPDRSAVLEQRMVDMQVERWSGSDVLHDQDLLAVEEALEIRLVYDATRKTISVTMRTPGNDPDLAIGFLFAEGLVVAPRTFRAYGTAALPRDRSNSGMSCASNCGPRQRLT